MGAVTHLLAKHLAGILGPLVAHSDHHVRDSRDFINKIKDVQVSNDHCMVFFDVASLFTSIPVDDALKSVERALLRQDSWKGKTSLSLRSIITLLEFCLDTTYFVYK